MFDCFIAELRCPECGTINPATSATNLQTHLRDDANGSELGVGAKLDPLDVRPEDILRSCYQLVAIPKAGESIRLLEEWQCPACGRPGNWAMISLRGGDEPTIEAIEAVTLDRATLDRAHFISDACELVAARLSGVPLNDLPTDHCVDLLREHLP